jgi:hypothetical protein
LLFIIFHSIQQAVGKLGLYINTHATLQNDPDVAIATGCSNRRSAKP